MDPHHNGGAPQSCAAPTPEKPVAFPEWRFHRGCFDLEKLKNSHSEHCGPIMTEPEPASYARGIDIACKQCRLAFTRLPWEFLYDKDDADFHSENDFKAYMLIRFDKRVDFLAELGKIRPERAETVRKKETELVRYREEFAKYGPKQRLLLSLEGWRDKWAAGDPRVGERGGGKPGGPARRATARSWWSKPTQHEPRQPATSAKPRTTVTWNAQIRNVPDPQPATSTTSPGEQGFGDQYNVGVMYFERNANNEPFFGITPEMPLSARPDYKFPNQRIPVDDVLSTDEQKLRKNPLAQDCPNNTLRYFHFPANNMYWIEVSIFVPAVHTGH